MNTQSWLTLLKKHRAIAVIRSCEKELARQMAQAVAAGGIEFIEITWNTQKAAELIAELRSDFPTFSIGTGTLLNLEDLQQVIPGVGWVERIAEGSLRSTQPTYIIVIDRT